MLGASSSSSPVLHGLSDLRLDGHLKNWKSERRSQKKTLHSITISTSQPHLQRSNAADKHSYQ